MLGRHVDVGRLALFPDDVVGIVEIDLVVAQVHVDERGDTVGHCEQVERVRREVGDRVVFPGDVDDVVLCVGRGPQQITPEPAVDPAVLASAVAEQHERQILWRRRVLVLGVILQPHRRDARSPTEGVHDLGVGSDVVDRPVQARDVLLHAEFDRAVGLNPVVADLFAHLRRLAEGTAEIVGHVPGRGPVMQDCGGSRRDHRGRDRRGCRRCRRGGHRPAAERQR